MHGVHLVEVEVHRAQVGMRIKVKLSKGLPLIEVMKYHHILKLAKSPTEVTLRSSGMLQNQI
eukprot:1730156-Ditylum_brightwellii.AAC.1